MGVAKDIQLGKMYKRVANDRVSPYPKYLIPTCINSLMTTNTQKRYSYIDVEKGETCGNLECITESSLGVFYQLVEHE